MKKVRNHYLDHAVDQGKKTIFKILLIFFYKVKVKIIIKKWFFWVVRALREGFEAEKKTWYLDHNWGGGGRPLFF